MTGPTRQPLLPVVNIQKTDDDGSFSSIYNFNPLSSPKILDYNLSYLMVHPPADRTGGRFEMKITSPSADNSTMNTILSNIIEGGLVQILIGKTNANKSLKFKGLMETIEITEPNKNLMQVTISGPDLGSDILKNRVINGSWVQRRLASDATMVDTTDTSTTVSQIITDMLSSSNRYLDTSGPTASDQGITFDSSQLTTGQNIQIAQFEANAEKLDDKLSVIDDLISTVHYVDATGALKIRNAINGITSGILITDNVNDSVAATWDQTKVGYIGPDFTLKRTLENHKQKLLGLGGDATNTDQTQTTTTTSTNLDSNYLAMRFTPQFQDCAQIDIYAGTVGIPVANLILELIEDYGGNPTGSILRTIEKTPSAIPTANWVSFPINEKLNVAKNYWIVIPKVGTASNTYKWYRDTTTSFTNASSSDGLTWTVNSSSYGFAFREYYSTPLISIYPNTTSATAKHLHEEVYRYPYIHQQQTLTNYLTAIAQPLTTRKDIISCSVYAPDTLLSIGQTIDVRKQASGYAIDTTTSSTGKYTIGDIEYLWQADDNNTTGLFWYNIQATTFTPYTY